MTNLNWFQARDLAQGERRAIRRSGWQKWLFYRFRLWLISETTGPDAATPDTETRRVATVGDFRDSEFLAKDWTDEVWSGGAYPPCTTPGRATALAASVSGGAGAWTRTAAQCGGDGEGGGVPPPTIIESNPGVTPTLTASVVAFLDETEAPLPPDTTPTAFIGKVLYSLPIDYVSSSSFPDVVGRIYIWFSPTGIDFSGAPVTAGGTISGADLGGGSGSWVAVGPGYGWSGRRYFPNVPATNYTYVSGTTLVTARVVLTDAAGATVITHADVSYSLPLSP